MCSVNDLVGFVRVFRLRLEGLQPGWSQAPVLDNGMGSMFGIIVGGRRDIARWRRRYAWWTSCRNC